MTVSKYKSKTGRISYRVRYRKPDGRNGSATFADKNAAIEFDRNRKTLGAESAEYIADAQDREGSNTTLQQYALEYAQSISGITVGTRQRYESFATKKLGKLARLPLKAVTPAAVSKWINELEQPNSKGIRLSGKTVSNYHGFVSGVMKHALSEGLIERNPCVGTRITKTPRKEMVFLSRAEFLALLKLIPSHGKDIVACMPTTGMRWSEITALQVKHINFEESTIRIAQAWKWNGSAAPTLGVPKTKKSIRTIGAPALVMEVVTRLSEGKMADDFVFTNPNTGGVWSKSSFQTRVWQPSVREFQKATGKKPRVHDMRHTCASWMIAEGVPLPVIQRHLGHESIQTTVDVYGHLEPAAMLRASAALNFNATEFIAIGA